MINGDHDAQIRICSINSNKLSFYRTSHDFNNYAEVGSIEQVQGLMRYAQGWHGKVYILGNGSNTLFSKSSILSLIVKNNLPKIVEETEEGFIRVSSSCEVIKVLRYCFNNNLDSFYYLAAVPATIGGAIAMNAGRGEKHKQSILDFVRRVQYVDSNGFTKMIDVSELDAEYRSTVFLNELFGFVVAVDFEFAQWRGIGDPIKERVEWSKAEQDNVGGNCGSVFKKSDFRILNRLRGVHIFGSFYSKKTVNWIVNRSSSPLGIRLLIFIAKIMHAAVGKKAVLELRVVE